MTIRYRPMRADDVRECVEIVAAHPIARSRYAEAMEDLCPAWLRLLANDGFCSATVFEEIADSRVEKIGMGVSVFISDDFLRELKASPHFWVGPEIARRVVRGQSPVLSAKQVRGENSRDGLNLAIWQATVRSEYAQRMEVWNALMAAGVEQHRGYCLKELLVAQAESVDHLLGLRHTGGFYWDAGSGRYGDLPSENLEGVISKPHVLGMTREMALNRALASITSVIGSLFVYHSPRFGFSRSEQRLLLSALQGKTDQELGDELSVSIDTVKKTWRLIYERVAQSSPELIPANAVAENGSSERGREKKQRLIAYLREHPEELRPVSRKLLSKNTNGQARG